MEKDIILFVNAIRPATFEALQMYQAQTGRRFKPIVLVDTTIRHSITARNGQAYAKSDLLVLSADFTSAASIRAALGPYMHRIFAVTSQYENSVNELKKLIPYLPYLATPTEKSLEWATEKKHMRQLMEAYDRTLIPQYCEVTDASDKTVAKICETMSFPLIVKPSGLEGSLLVSMVTTKAELQDVLTRTFIAIQGAYDKWIKRQIPAVLVEEFMKGDMYSVDTYVSARGTCVHTPPVKVITGRKAGFDDFFGYIQRAPAGLPPEELEKAYDAVERACRAVCLRSVTAHVELMRTEDGWKIIELGPRIGGFRHEIYAKTYGINHIVNDILNRGGEAPVIPTAIRAHTAYLNIYAREEGVLAAVSGLDAVKRLASFQFMKQCAYVGEEVLFAKNNGDPVYQLCLSNESEAVLEQDIANVERSLRLMVEQPEEYLRQKADPIPF